MFYHIPKHYQENVMKHSGVFVTNFGVWLKLRRNIFANKRSDISSDAISFVLNPKWFHQDLRETLKIVVKEKNELTSVVSKEWKIMRQYGGFRADIRKVIQGQSNLKELHKKDYCDNVNSIILTVKTQFTSISFWYYVLCNFELRQTVFSIDQSNVDLLKIFVIFLSSLSSCNSTWKILSACEIDSQCSHSD